MRSIYIDKNTIGCDLMVNNFSFVKKDETVGFVRNTKGIETEIVSPCDGYFYREPGWYYSDKKDSSPLASVFDSIQELFSYHYSCEGSTVEIDPYTGLRRIEWRNKLFSWLSFVGDEFSVEFYENKMLFCFDTLKKLQIGDCISLLFDNGKIIDFPITTKPVKQRFGRPYKYKTSFILYQEDVEALLDSTLVSYRITYKEDSTHPETVKIGDNRPYADEEIHAYVKNRLDTIKQLVPDYQLPHRVVVKTPIGNQYNWCYVYLMRDNANGYHKIGISNTPEYRERTLQSEKPSIEMLACKKFPTRKIAEAIESALHTTYNQQRLRGEWFNLNDEDVAAIIETLK